MRVCTVSKPNSKQNRRIEWKNFQGCFINKKEQKHRKRLSFITQFKIEFLLPFTSCRKVFGKMLGPAQLSVRKRLYSGARKRH